MARLYDGLEALAEAEGGAAYRFCLLLTGRTRAAERAAFQGFLYLSGETGPLSAEEERRRLYALLFRTAEDVWYRRSSSPLRRAALEEELGAPVSDRLWRFLRRSLKRKAAFWLVRCAGFSEEDAAAVLRLRPRRLQGYLAAEAEPDALRGELLALSPAPAWEEQLGDNLLLRCQERNVPLENRLLRIRSAADRAVPYLALAVVLLCAAAVWYVTRL